jgi:predicted ATPase
LLEPPDQAEGHFLLSLLTIRKQQAKSFELRAGMALARLWRNQGRRNEARDCSLRSTAGSQKGFDTRDLKETKALLDALPAA